MLEGKCGCGAVTYRMTSTPIFVHNCHCSDCQTQTGSAYVINAMIETDRVSCQGPTVDRILSTPSGKGQVITRCAECGVAIFSKYMTREGKITYVRVGTLDNPNDCPPEVQIFTSSKQSWVPLSTAIPAFENFYSFEEVWPNEALARWKAALA